MQFSKRLISDIRALLWVVTVGGLLLAAILLPILDRKGVGALFKPASKAAPAEELPTAPGTYEFDPWDE